MLRTFSEGIQDKSDLKTYIISFRDNYDKLKVDSRINTIRSYGGKPKYAYSSVNAIAIKLPANAIGTIKILPFVKNITESQAVSVDQYNNMYYATDVSPNAEIPWGIAKVRAPEVHAQGNKGTGVKVCVVDTGIDKNHPDLANNYKGGYDVFTGSPNQIDGHGHGTHVAGTIAANGGIIGVAPEAYLYAAKVLDDTGSGTFDTIMAGIQWAIDNGMQVINMSLGSKDYTGLAYDATFDALCRQAYTSANIVVICSAGNNKKIEKDTCGFPARFNSCVGVGNNQENDTSSSSSSQGPAVEVSAPGTNIKSCKKGGGYTNMSGTSMASPHVSGVAALVRKAHPNFTAQNVKGVLCAAVDDLGAPGRDNIYGFGKIDAVKAVAITNPPAPPADMSGKMCMVPQNADASCQTFPVKADQCNGVCDCHSGQMQWCCEADGCGLDYAPVPGCPGKQCFGGDLMACNDVCEEGGCANPSVSFTLN